jgi:hypothetical protein
LVGSVLLLGAATLAIAAAPFILAALGIKKLSNAIDENVDPGIVKVAIKTPITIAEILTGVPAVILGASAVMTGLGGNALMAPLVGEVMKRNQDKIEEKGKEFLSKFIGDKGGKNQESWEKKVQSNNTSNLSSHSI